MSCTLPTTMVIDRYWFDIKTNIDTSVVVTARSRYAPAARVSAKAMTGSPVVRHFQSNHKPVSQRWNVSIAGSKWVFPS